MKEGSNRSGKGPFGCLIVKKKGTDGIGMTTSTSNGGGGVILGKQKKRPRLILSESESDEEESLAPPPPPPPPPLPTSNTDSFDIVKKIKPPPEIYREESRVDRNKVIEGGIERKRKFDKVLVKDGVEERRTEIGRNGVLISKTRIPVGKRKEFEPESSRRVQDGNRDHLEFNRGSNLSVERERESVRLDRQRFETKKHGDIRPGLLREKFAVQYGKPIRVQGKNGVLKVMPSNKNKVGGSGNFFSPKKEEENRKGFSSADYSNGKAHLSPSLYSENKSHEKSHSVGVNPLKKLSIKHNEVRDQRTQVSETSLSRDSKNVGTGSSKKEASNKKQKTLASEPCVSTKRKEGEVKRGSGTEKQLLREEIRQMLVNAGWTIDLRPRRNRDYQDSVYINPSGTEYWSITKAYYAFQKQFEDEGRDQTHSGDFSSFNPIPEDVLSKLTRKTRKKIEREMKMQQKADRGSKSGKQMSEKKLKNKHVKVKTDSSMNEENSNSYTRQDDKSLKVKIQGNNVLDLNTDDIAQSKRSTPSKAGCGNGEYKKQRGRALLVRNTTKGQNIDGDDFVPYTGKRTVLSWLIDMGTVPLSGKVKYMNKKRTRAMLEGWITRDGIHCRCCSKILTISKFELHAGSKLHHPFQNIIVENGVSLYQCQLDAWNKQDKSVRLGFHFIDVDGDDPNDDTCGICGDGGDLICCDGCPSTFHQSCLDIKMLPSGDWLCPNCYCKFCGGVDGSTGQEEDTTLCSCSLCEDKYHRLCRQHADATSIDSDSLSISFCGKACAKLFQQLQKLVGVKHELEAGFSWTLIQRATLDSDVSSRGQCQKAECNSKIAVALTVMDECFLPVTDQRSGVSLIHNVLFNIGSNFNRLNYCGFYTAVLERGDEIIAAASIRIHGTRLAEMPFIGTRHIYRRQGMCRRLLNAVESALCSLNVEKLVIPAISELMDTWTTVFGFKPLEELHRQEVKTLNMLVFPSTDLLQKPLLMHKLNEVDVTESSVVKAVEADGNKHVMPEMGEKIVTSTIEPDTCAPAKVAVCETGPRSPGGSTHDSFDMISDPSDTSLGIVPDHPSNYSVPDPKLRPHGVNHDNQMEVETNPICNSSVERKLKSSARDDPHEVNVEAAALEPDLHVLDETSVPHTSGNNSDCPSTASDSSFQPTDRALVQNNSDWSEQNVDKVEGKADLCSVERGICAPDKGVVCNNEMNCGVGSIETGPQGLPCSSYDRVNKRLDAAVEAIPYGPSEGSARDTMFPICHAVGHDIKFDVETKAIFGSSVESKLQNTTEDDAHGVKVKAAGVEFDLHPLDETSVQHTRNTNYVQSRSDLNEHKFQKVECKSEMVSFELGIFPCERSVVYDRKVDNGDTCSGFSGSTCDTSDMIGHPSYAALSPIPDAFSGESALESKYILPCVDHDTKLDVETKFSLDLKLQNCTVDDILEVNLQAASGGHTNINSNDPNAICGNSFQRADGNHMERRSDLKENDIHNMECTSIEVCHGVSDAIYLEANVRSTSEESIKVNVSEGKTEVSARASDLYPSDEGRAHYQLQAAALRNNF